MASSPAQRMLLSPCVWFCSEVLSSETSGARVDHVSRTRSQTSLPDFIGPIFQAHMSLTVYLCRSGELDRDDHLIPAIYGMCYSHRSRDLGLAHDCSLRSCGTEKATAHDDSHVSPTITKSPNLPRKSDLQERLVDLESSKISRKVLVFRRADLCRWVVVDRSLRSTLFLTSLAHPQVIVQQR